jgi:hypothetical protein
MRRNAVTGLLVALALALALPGSCSTSAGVWSGADCCIDFGVRLILSIGEGEIRGSLILPHFGAGQGGRENAGSLWFGRAGVELVRVALNPADVVRWAIPVVSALAELNAMELGETVAETEPARREEL